MREERRVGNQGKRGVINVYNNVKTRKSVRCCVCTPDTLQLFRPCRGQSVVTQTPLCSLLSDTPDCMYVCRSLHLTHSPSSSLTLSFIFSKYVYHLLVSIPTSLSILYLHTIYMSVWLRHTHTHKPLLDTFTIFGITS